VVSVKGAKLEGGEIASPKLVEGEARSAAVARMKSDVLRVKIERGDFGTLREDEFPRST